MLSGKTANRKVYIEVSILVFVELALDGCPSSVLWELLSVSILVFVELALDGTSYVVSLASLPVSILVFVELALDDPFMSLDSCTSSVSILVFVELALDGGRVCAGFVDLPCFPWKTKKIKCKRRVIHLLQATFSGRSCSQKYLQAPA